MEGNYISLGYRDETFWELIIVGIMDTKRYRMSLSKIEWHKLF